MTYATPTFLPGLVERWAGVRGVRLRWFEGGEGPTVVLLHGFGGAASNWTLVAPRLLPGHRVLVPDLPGHGGSSALAAPPDTLDPFADRVAALLEADEAPVLAVGHSMGGVVAPVGAAADAGSAARPRSAHLALATRRRAKRVAEKRRVRQGLRGRSARTAARRSERLPCRLRALQRRSQRRPRARAD